MKQNQFEKAVRSSKRFVKMVNSQKMKKEKVTGQQLRDYLFGWLWVEKNIMKEVRKKLGEKR